MSRSFRPWLAFALFALGASIAIAQPVVMRVSHQVPPAHHLTKLLQGFAADVKARTNGSVDVQLFGSEQLAKAAENFRRSHAATSRPPSASISSGARRSRR
jgi:TRAP-type C4-dicarboxylate transport system substrate-binding protein